MSVNIGEAQYDDLLKMGIKPFVELGFTPQAMRSSKASVFYWKGNISHPDPAKWSGLVEAFVRHLQDRYGKEEVRTWFFEVWNEPNLGFFWEKADQNAYFALYDNTARTIKAVDPALRVGGPSTAGAAWIAEFLARTRQSGAIVDFVTTHTYGAGDGFLDTDGKFETRLLASPDAIIGDVRKARKEMTDAGYPDKPLYFTEWSSSWGPRDPVHDSYIMAPYILSKLKGTEGMVQAMSYWTFSDFFEELGPPKLPFQGTFGLMTIDGIRKPSWFAYKYLNQLGETAIPTGDPQSYAARDAAGVQVLMWDFELFPQTGGNREVYGRIVPARDVGPVTIQLKGLQPGAYSVQVHRTGHEANDAFTAYLKMGSPTTLTPQQLDQLRISTQDLPEESKVQVPASGTASFKVKMRMNDLVLVKLSRE